MIRKGHRIVESDLHLVLLSKHKKFDDDTIAGICSSIGNSERRKNLATTTISI